LQFSGGIGNQALGSLKIGEETSNTKNPPQKAVDFINVWESP
jgi:hypothetical protein